MFPTQKSIYKKIVRFSFACKLVLFTIYNNSIYFLFHCVYIYRVYYFFLLASAQFTTLYEAQRQPNKIIVSIIGQGFNVKVQFGLDWFNPARYIDIILLFLLRYQLQKRLSTSCRNGLHTIQSSQANQSK